MKKSGRRNDWWDWCIILLFVAGGTLALWAGVWVAHSYAADARHPPATALLLPHAGLAADVRTGRCMERQG